jgi:hemerythrin-like metal-binding protein
MEYTVALITWSSMLAVGVTEIDDQHKKLIELVNRLNDAMHAGEGKAVLQPVLNELVRYTQYHFGTEERLMAKHHYESSTEHKAEHQKFVKEVSAFKTKFDAGNAMLSNELMAFLRDWLSRHILQSDKKFARAIQAQGVH